MGKEEIREKIVDLSCGVLASVIDFVLFALLYGAEAAGAGYSSPKVARAAERAFDQLERLAIDKETIKRAIWKATHKGLIRRQRKKDKTFWRITRAGKKRLSSLLPQYDEKRVWDGRIYLITYDIPEKRANDRDLLREFLKKIGCGMLQASVWLTPYNPKELLREFIEKRKLSGTVIISDIGKDGSVGEEDLDDLIRRVYNLDQLNDRYEDFIYQVKNRRLDKSQIAFQFLSILSGDPQLPFELLPYNWQGKKAYQLFKEKCNPS